MNLQTSCFNSAVFRSDAKRLWWVSALHTLSIFLLCLLPLYMNYHDTVVLFGEVGEPYENSVLFRYSVVPYIALGVFTVGMSVLLFSYLNSKSAVAAMHAVPVKRKTLYITHVIFGFAALIIPILINGGILAVMRSNPNIAQVIPAEKIGAWIFTQIGYAVIGFAFSVLIGMFTGSSIAHLVFTYIFAVLPFLAENALKYIIHLNLYGYVMNDTDMAVLKFLYFSADTLTDPTSFFMYIAYALIFLLIGYFVYKIRNLENSGEIVAFPKLKPIFVYGVSVCFGVAGYFYLVGIPNINNLFFALPFGLLGLIIANMLAKKAFTVKGILKPAAALVLSVAALFCLFHFDITGFEKRVPDAEAIESVSITDRSPDTYGFSSLANGRKIVPKDVYIPNLTNRKDIENVLRFHEHKTVERTEAGNNTEVFYLRYHLKNGKIVNRCYIADVDDDKDYLKPIMETEENLTYRFPVLGNTNENISSLTVNDTRLSDSFNSYFTAKESDAEIVNRLTEALRADLKQVTYEEFIHEVATPTYIQIDYEIPMVYEGTDILVPHSQSDRTYDETHTYCIRPSYTNTIALLTELGLYDVLPKATDYQSVAVWRVPFVNNSAQPSETITDPTQLAEIYNYVTTTQPNLKLKYHSDIATGNAIKLTFRSDEFPEFTVTWSNDDAKMPSSLSNLFRSTLPS